MEISAHNPPPPSSCSLHPHLPPPHSQVKEKAGSLQTFFPLFLFLEKQIVADYYFLTQCKRGGAQELRDSPLPLPKK